MPRVGLAVAIVTVAAVPAPAVAKRLGPPPKGLKGTTDYGSFSVSPSFAVSHDKHRRASDGRVYYLGRVTTTITLKPNSGVGNWTLIANGVPVSGTPGNAVQGSKPQCRDTGADPAVELKCTYIVGVIPQWVRIGVEFCRAPPPPPGPFGGAPPPDPRPACQRAEAAYAVVPPGTKGPKGPQPNGVDWRMPPRLGEEVKHWTASEGLPERDQVHPKKWRAALFLTRNGNAVDSCPSGKWEWKVDPPKDAKVVDKPGPGCKTSMEVSQLGKYKITVHNRKQDTTVHGTVDVKDWLIAGFGDSNGSGEGNPPFLFDRCNRGLASYQYLTAQYVESHDPRSSVTFLWASCSGAIIQDIYKTKYEGINPSAGVLLQPQIKQVAYLAERHTNDPKGPDRKVDAAIVSIGVNNLGFGPLLAYCVLNLSASDPCQNRIVQPTINHSGGVDSFETSSGPQSMSLQNWIAKLTGLLPATYAPLAHAFAAKLNSDKGGTLGLPRSDVVITQYPDFTRGDNGQPCSGTIGPTSTWAFVGLAAANLDAAVAQSANANGWKPVLLPQSIFTGPPAGHGYCSSVPYFVTLNSALAAGNKPGAFHPNGSGHFATAQATVPQICDVLYGNPKCDGKP